MRKLILALIVIPMLLVLGIGTWLFLEHARGKQSWLAWKAERTAQGDRFDWKDLAPPEIPDAENFAMAPLIAGAITGKHVDPRFKALEPPKLEKEWGDWKEGRRIDLQACAVAYKTKDLLKALAPFEATLKELEEAARRPHSRIQADYAEYETPGLLGFRGAVRTLRLRALVNLNQGKSEAALKDIQTCVRIADHLKAEPHLLAALLRIAVQGLAMQPIWEGILDHRWNAQQLSVMQAELEHVNILASTRIGFEGERMIAICHFTCGAEGAPLPKGLRDLSDSKPPTQPGWFAKGWFYRNLLELDRFEAASWLDIIHPESHRVFPEKQIDLYKWMKDRRFRKDLILAQIAIPALMGQVERAARVQSGIDQAAIACALERYWLAKGAYPASLAELSPAFMAKVPPDVVNGQPLRYQRQGESFLLYSLGWDLKDDGGRAVWTKDPKPSVDPVKGDWPWVALAK